MFGYLRFVLAMAVVASHIGVRTFEGSNPGVAAVVFFYILAGYVVAHLFTKVIPQGKNRLLLFYRDRVLRIFPLYLYVSFITVAFLVLTSFGKPEFDPLKLFYNFSIIPLDYYMYIESTILQEPKWQLIPPAWSLGAELQAYLLLPLALLSKHLYRLLFVLSLVVYVAANFSLLHSDYFGYRLLPGVFFLFLLGVAVYEKKWKSLFALWLAALLLFGWFLAKHTYGAYTRETLFGILVALPLFWLLVRIPKNLPGNTLFGAFSYALFITHFLALWVLEYFDAVADTTAVHFFCVLLLASLISAPGVLFLEKKVEKYRKFEKV